MTKKVVVVGLGTGGVYGTKAISNFDRKAEITVFEKREYESYSPCSMPYAIAGLTDVENLKIPFPTTRKIKLLTGFEVTEIDTYAKTVKARNVDSGEERKAEYDYLLFTPGSSPFMPPIKGLDELPKDRVHVLKFLEHAEAIKRRLENQPEGSVVIIGGGAIGLELAASIKESWAKTKVSVVEMMPEIMPNMDPDMGSLVRGRLEEKGVDFHSGAKVEELKEDGDIKVGLNSGDTLNTDMVILAVGMRGNTSLLEGKVDMKNGLIVVDDGMNTSDDSVYSVGDCVLMSNAVGSEKGPAQYATAAMKEALVAGMNIAGLDVSYKGVTNTVTSHIAQTEVASTGLSSSQCEDSGLEYKTSKARYTSKPKWFDGKEIVLKLIYGTDATLLGAQAVGEGATDTVNTLSALIRKKGTLVDILGTETAYCPYLSELYSVMQMAAELGLRRMKFFTEGKGISV